jgi:hypothetical protein
MCRSTFNRLTLDNTPDIRQGEQLRETGRAWAGVRVRALVEGQRWCAPSFLITRTIARRGMLRPIASLLF